MVRFFHRKHECYIVAEGSFAGKAATLEATEDLVRRRMLVQDAGPSTTSARIVDTGLVPNSGMDPSPLEEQSSDMYKEVVHIEVYEDTANSHKQVQQSYTRSPLESPSSSLSRSSSCLYFDVSSDVDMPELPALPSKVATESRRVNDPEVVKDNKVVTNDGNTVYIFIAVINILMMC